MYIAYLLIVQVFEYAAKNASNNTTTFCVAASSLELISVHY